MYINAQLQTCSIQAPNSVLLTDDLATKLAEYRHCAKAVLDDSGNLIDIEYDEEKAAKNKTKKEEERLERNLIRIQNERRSYLQAFDIYKSNLLYFNEEESEEEHLEIVEWYNTLLDITEDVTADNVPEFPEVPLKIQQYL